MSRRKHPSTPHLPFSSGRGKDDGVLRSMAHMAGRSGVATKKMDGENTSLYRDGFHARSLDSRHHPSRDWIAAYHASIAPGIPEGWRVCGENLYARHSIAYDRLPAYFMGFSAWDERNVALSWDDTLGFFHLLGIQPVPEVWRGEIDERTLRGLARDWDANADEGFVVRLAGSIAYNDFGSSVAKWVRPGHVQTDDHWMHGAVVPNGLARG